MAPPRTKKIPDPEHVIPIARYLSARRAFRSDAQLAETLGVNRSSVTRWKRGNPPDPENAERLLGLDVVVELLSGYLSDESIPKWLHGINAYLDDRRPIDVLQAGRLADVVAAIEAQRSGAYA